MKPSGTLLGVQRSSLPDRESLYGSAIYRGACHETPMFFFRAQSRWAAMRELRLTRESFLCLVHGRQILPACRRAWQQNIGQFLVSAIFLGLIYQDQAGHSNEGYRMDHSVRLAPVLGLPFSLFFFFSFLPLTINHIDMPTYLGRWKGGKKMLGRVAFVVFHLVREDLGRLASEGSLGGGVWLCGRCKRHHGNRG